MENMITSAERARVRRLYFYGRATNYISKFTGIPVVEVQNCLPEIVEVPAPEVLSVVTEEE